MLSQDKIDQFDKNGYLVLENFLNSDQCTRLHQEAQKIIQNVIDNEDLEQVHVFPFVSKEKSPTKEEFDYFMKSGQDIKLFLNHKEYTAESHVDTEAKARVIMKRANRIGHALHALNPIFKEFTFSDQIKDVVKSFGLKKPIICQSMYLMMQSPEGRSSKAHQASNYLLVEPSRLLSFWCAITECNVENGCLEVIPGSHKKGSLKNKFIRNPNEQEFNEGKRFVYTEERAESKEEGEYVPVPLNAGSVLLMDGFLIHRATNSTSPEPRNVYAFHCYDSENGQFSEQNWMEYSDKTFLPLYQ